MVAFLLQQQKTQIRAMSSTTNSTSTSTSSINKKININDTKDNSNESENKNKEEIKLNNLESSAATVQSPDLGYLLVAFFHHFGNPYNLNSHTIVKVRLQAYMPPHTAASHQSKYFYYLSFISLFSVFSRYFSFYILQHNWHNDLFFIMYFFRWRRIDGGRGGFHTKHAGEKQDGWIRD